MIYEGGSSIKLFNLEKFICLETQESQYTANVLKWWNKSENSFIWLHVVFDFS